MLALLGLALAQTADLARPARPDLSGTWRLTYDIVTKNDVPVIGALKSTSRSVVLVKIAEQDGALTVTHDVCGSQIDGGLVKSELPPAYLSHIPQKRYPITLDQRDDGKWVAKADTGLFQAGFDPARCSDVPDDPEAACVIDWDGDGNPGATIKAKAPLFPWVEVYVAQRNHLVLEGAVVSSDRVEGAAWLASMENRVIGASNKLFARATPKAEVARGESVFAMRRLPAEATCREVLAP